MRAASRDTTTTGQGIRDRRAPNLDGGLGGHRRGKVGKTYEGEGMSSGQARTGGHSLGRMFPGSFTVVVSRWQPSLGARPVGQLLKGGPCHPYSFSLRKRGQGAARSTGAGHRCMVRVHRSACSAGTWRAACSAGGERCACCQLSSGSISCSTSCSTCRWRCTLQG